ncbi:MAG: glycosyltransferase family 2 protein [Lachnospiraceae bacterium]|nr:glycosyltransferase family 2 protein [Lachnospiraceae bacterium]
MGAWFPQGCAAAEDAYQINAEVFLEVGVEAVVGEVRISVAMVTYHGAKYLRAQLDSILSQLQERDELVVSDDGSTDGTAALLREYQQSDRRIRLLQGPRQGLKKNVEHAIAHTRGEYIFLADQDDIWSPRKVERVMEAFAGRDRPYVVIHDARVFAGDDTEDIQMESFLRFRSGRPGVIKNIIKNSYIGCCMAFRQELKELILPIPASIEMHDQWIGVLSDCKFSKSCFLWEPLLLYRRHDANNSKMVRYGIGKMLRNRLVFCSCFFVRILHFAIKKTRKSRKIKKNDD